MSEYKMKPGKIGEAVIDAYKKVEDAFVDTFLERDENGEATGELKTGKLGSTVVDAYHKVEDTVVGGYKKIEDAFVDTFLEKVEEDTASEGESAAQDK